MTFKLQQNFLAIITISCAAAFVGCASMSNKPIEQANTAKPPATIESKTTETINKGAGNVETKTVKTTTIETKDGEPNKTTHENSTNLTASSGDKIGVPECDEYIEKYEACVKGKVPEAARGLMQSSIEQMRKSWKQVAAQPQAGAALAGGCKQARETPNKV
ncbi:MAG: hypothetical protein LH614_01430 [Pyrinomonadaceae bacterium]|nr:hypothetical protein [Pyrinomonadaceae bacterium]